MARILIIDDEPDVRDILERLLRAASHEVVTAGDGAEALKALASFNPELVISDVFMPNRDGVETLIDLRKRSPNLPVIAISGQPAAVVMLQVAQRLGAVAVLKKPFTREQLLTAVTNALA